MESGGVAEVFVTANPTQAAPLRTQAEALFSGIADVLRSHKARILQERLFGTDTALQQVLSVRTAVYGTLDDGVAPLLLSVPEGPYGGLCGVQVHAVSCAKAPTVLRREGAVYGRRVDTDGLEYVMLSGLVAPSAGANTKQARAIYEKAASALRDAGAEMCSVARTWLWLEDILAWYDDFNSVRSGFFRECGIIQGGRHENRLPASTGIGVGPAGRPHCALDVIATIGEKACIQYYRAAGMQQPPFEYGSAFSRAATATTPAGKTVYVSGTAAIDEAGLTQHVDDPKGQVDMTITNVQAVLHDIDCADADVVHAIAYSKTPQVQEVFHRDWAHLGWPFISVISDICRDELLFEVEATACPGARAV
ncbi:MAG: hypothetical protein AMS14_06040 [Planctomycetes bacterium DG_20]|nr:MAG: hypothetical protein AMS14_06040 [Planctomycetes bacterium DG_20]